jgi:two-component system NtrC family response regulator
LDDVPELAKHLLVRHRPESARIAEPFDQQAIKQLKNHSWGGNIRELANVVERAAIINDVLPIGVDDLPSLSSLKSGNSAGSLAGKSLREVEMETIYATLDQHDGNKTAAARQLGISLKTLYNKLNADISTRAA